ncbi:hypothetical protein [Thiocystis violacea]|uniref:hypothetical protein n=1 Tax=Thiocystis violacea TaxID=13725 RepID=UPI001903C2A6|nr:hypothetical protein [Thiocystis violacea]MBK1718684.1 hypothetical protein [Thiocystis violacea]
MHQTKHIHTPVAALLTLALAAPGGALAYDQSSAISDCQSQIFNDARYHNPHGASATETGRHSYKVNGLVKDRQNKDHRFNCRIENREVVSWNVSPEGGHSDSDSKAAMIGAGIIGLAVIAAAVSQDKGHQDKRDAYDRGEGYALDDMDYLKKECAHELRFHLERDYGDVSDLRLKHPYLSGRTLTGNGRVSFEDSDSRDLSFTCDFDRRGGIHDGRYTLIGPGYAD